MRFSVLATLATVSTLGSAYVLDLYSSHNCDGDPIATVNVVDNSCSNSSSIPSFWSAQPTKYGGSGQKAWFYAQDSCADATPGENAFGGYLADGTSNSFITGECFDFTGAPSEMQAVGSSKV